MKINTYASQAVHMFDRVNEKNPDKQGGSGSQAFEQHKKDQENKEEFEVTVENVQKAIETFSSNETNQSHGLSATQEGVGPGLKVTLRDATGGILRSVSGEEFLKLRDAIQSGSKSGRILDQKV